MHLVNVNDSHVSVIYGRATRTSIAVVSSSPTKTWGAAHAQTIDTRRSPITECLGTRLHAPIGTRYAPKSEMRLISNDIPQKGSVLQFKL